MSNNVGCVKVLRRRTIFLRTQQGGASAQKLDTPYMTAVANTMSGILKQALNDTLSFETSSLDALRLTLIDLLEHTDEALLVTEFISQCPEGTIVECVPELSHALGCSQLVDVLRRVWSQLNESQKLNIAMVAGVCESLSDDLWSFLFEDPSNTVHVRHRIAAGLAHSRNEVTRKLFPTLLSKIGKYDDPMRQAVLEGFLKNYG